ncbi:MAG: hypothetical protein R3B09_23850 [Nannocystaceae bacterium]
MWSDIEDAVWRELGGYYLDEDMPLMPDEASKQAFLDRAASGSAWRLRQRLKGQQRADAAALLRAIAANPEAHPVMDQVLRVGQYDWFRDREQRALLTALLHAIAYRIDGE